MTPAMNAQKCYLAGLRGYQPAVTAVTDMAPVTCGNTSNGIRPRTTEASTPCKL
jgi:hypothetical protein